MVTEFSSVATMERDEAGQDTPVAGYEQTRVAAPDYVLSGICIAPVPSYPWPT